MAASLCSGPVRRREFLRVGTLALGGLTLPELLRRRAEAQTATSDTSVILFWMWGGPSQLETFDMKPDAPSEYRGPLRPIRTNVPGIEICEYMPLAAQMADKFALVRSLYHQMSAHNDGSIEVLTGKTPSTPDPTSQAHSEHPDFGMVASRIRGARPDGLPQYIGVQRSPFMTNTAYLGASHKAFETGDPSAGGFAPRNLTLVTGLDNGRLDDRRDLVGQFDRFRKCFDREAEGIEQFRAAAFDILTSTAVARAFDLSREDPKLRDRYGSHRWGQSCLLARRLAEAGAAVINIDATAPNDTTKHFSWDDHAGAFHLDYAQRDRLPQMDQALTALIGDLHDRGLRMGQAVGATNSKSEYPTHDPVTPQDLLATVYRHLRIDYRRDFVNLAGRPVPILPSGEPIAKL